MFELVSFIYAFVLQRVTGSCIRNHRSFKVTLKSPLQNKTVLSGHIILSWQEPFVSAGCCSSTPQ